MTPVTVLERYGRELGLPKQATSVCNGETHFRYRVCLAYWNEVGVRVTALDRGPFYLPYAALDLRSLAALDSSLRNDLAGRVRAARQAKPKLKMTAKPTLVGDT